MNAEVVPAEGAPPAFERQKGLVTLNAEEVPEMEVSPALEQQNHKKTARMLNECRRRELHRH